MRVIEDIKRIVGPTLSAGSRRTTAHAPPAPARAAPSARVSRIGFGATPPRRFPTRRGRDVLNLQTGPARSTRAYISPHCAMVTGRRGRLVGSTGTFSILRMTIQPSACAARRAARVRRQARGGDWAATRTEQAPEDDMLAVEEVALGACDEELAAVRVGSGVGLLARRRADALARAAPTAHRRSHHRQQPRPGMLHGEALIGERVAVDADAAGAIALLPAAERHGRRAPSGRPRQRPQYLDEIAALDHEVLDDAVKGGALVADRASVAPILACAELSVCSIRQRADRMPSPPFSPAPSPSCTPSLALDSVPAHRKFSAVLGTASAYSSIVMRPICIGAASIGMSDGLRAAQARSVGSAPAVRQC